MHDHDEFAACALRRTADPGIRLIRRQGHDGLELLGQLTGQRDGACAQHGQLPAQGGNAVRSFEQHHRAPLRLQGLQRLGTLPALAGQESGKHPASLQSCHAIAELGGICPRRTQRREHAARAGQRHHPLASLAHGLHQPGAGIAHGGRAGIAHIRNPFPLPQPRHHALRRRLLVVLVQREQLGLRPGQAVGSQHGLGVSGVLAGHRIHHLQHLQCPYRDVGQVADRGGDQIQGACRI